MIRKALIAGLLTALAACSKTGDTNRTQQTAPTNSETNAVSERAPAGDPCTLLTDPSAIFGTSVTANGVMMPNQTNTCEWRVDDRMCGSLSVFGPGWNEAENVRANYQAMTTSMKAFGDVKDLAGIGEEARAVDGGVLGAQIAFRTKNVAALVAASCGNAERSQAALAEALAKAVAEKL